MDEEEQQQSDSKISVSSFFERVDSVDKVAGRALSKANANFDIINNQKTFINSINISIEALETKVRDIANYIIIEKKVEKDAEEDRLFEQQDESQKGSMLERLAGLKSNNESEQTQAAGEEPKKGGGILGTLLTLGIGAFALKFLWPVILPLAGKLITGALAKFAAFSIGGIGSLIKAIVVGSGLTGIGFGIGGLMEKFADSAKNRSDAVAKSAANAIKNFKFKKDGGVDGPNEISVEEGGEGGGEGGGEVSKDDDKDSNLAFKDTMSDTLEDKDLVPAESFSEYRNRTGNVESEEKEVNTELKNENVEEVEEERKSNYDTYVGADGKTYLEGNRRNIENFNSLDSSKRFAKVKRLNFLNFFRNRAGLPPIVPPKGVDISDFKISNESSVEPVKEIEKAITPNVENKDLDLSMSDTFSDKFQSLNNQVDMLSEDLTGTINTESGQMFSRPANSPNTTVTVFKNTSSNTPFTSLMSNKYLSLNKTLPPEVYRAIK